MLTTYRLLLPLPSQMIAFVKLWRYPCPTDSPNLFTASGGKGGIYKKNIPFPLQFQQNCYIPHSLMNYFPSISFFQAERKARNFSEVPRGRLRTWIPGGMVSSKRCGFISLTSL